MLCKSDSLPEKIQCRICDAPATFLFHDRRPFYICPRCGLIFTDGILSVKEEQNHYQDQYVHEYDWNAEARAILRATRFGIEPQKILDYGSGSGKLSDALRSMGLAVDSYEPMFHGDFKTANYAFEYDLVILNQVFEHLEEILKVVADICSVTRHGGIIFISTLMTDEAINNPDHFIELFRNWWYKDDPTHISFYCTRTFEYICEVSAQYKLQLVDTNSQYAILQVLKTDQPILT